MHRKMIGLYSAIMLLYGVAMIRLYMLTCSPYLTSAASQQSTFTLDITSTRGAVYDCRGSRMTEQEMSFVSAVAPSPGTMEVLAHELRGPQRSRVFEQMREGTPFLLESGARPLYGSGIRSVPVYSRYGAHAIAPHILGYMNQEGTGVSGIEAAYDEELKSAGNPVSVRYQVDAAMNMVRKSKPQLLGEIKPPESGIMLTLDKEIQQAADVIAEQMIPKGALVVMDVKTGEIKASASSPVFSPDQVARYLDSPDAPLLNRSFCGYSVGSTFKLAVAAAALEKGITPEYTMECKGGIEVDGRMVHCHDWGGHSWIDMKRAVEQSCNPYFISLGQKTGAENIIAMASAMGFGKETHLAPGLTAGRGNLTQPEEAKSGLALANLSFGQGNLLATPVQVASMVSSIANGGYAVTPSLVKGWTEDGKELQHTEPVFAENRIMSDRTAETLRKFMIGVVENGSGTHGKPGQGGAGGKTASAQTGHYDEWGHEIVHAWFGGFYPAQNPEYAIVVLVEEGEYGGKIAAPVFRRMADQIAKIAEERRVLK